MQVKRLLHIFVLTQVLILFGGLGQAVSHTSHTDSNYLSSFTRFSSSQEYIPAHTLSGTQTNQGHWIFSIISEVETENEEEHSSAAHKYIAASKYLINLLLAGDPGAFFADSDSFRFVSDDLANTLSERIYLVLAVFRL